MACHSSEDRDQHGPGRSHTELQAAGSAVADLAHIAGQKPVTTKAKKSIAAFKVREAMPSAPWSRYVPTRRTSFFDRLVSGRPAARARLSRRVDQKVLTGAALTLACATSDLPEIDYAKVEKLKGMNITFVDHGEGRQQRVRCSAFGTISEGA